MGVIQSNMFRELVCDLPASNLHQKRRKLRSVHRSPAKPKPINILLSYRGNDNSKSDMDRPHSPVKSHKKHRLPTRRRRFKPTHLIPKFARNFNILQDTGFSVPENLFDIQFTFPIEDYISGLIPQSITLDDVLWPREWNIPSYRNLYDFIAQYTNSVLKRNNQLPNESFVLTRIYNAYNAFVESFYSYINAIANDCAEVCENSLNGVKRSLEYNDIDDSCLADIIQCNKRRKRSILLSMESQQDNVQLPSFINLLTNSANNNLVGIVKLSRSGMSALSRLHSMIMALSMDYQIYNQLSDRMKSVKDGLFSFKFSSSLPSPSMPQLPQLQLPNILQLNKLGPYFSYYMSSMSNRPSMQSIFFIRTIASKANIKKVINFITDQKELENGNFNFINYENENNHRFKEHIEMHTSHWGEEAYDHVEVRLWSQRGVNNFKIPDTCTIM